MVLNTKEYCAVPIKSDGELMDPLDNAQGPIKSSSIEDMLELAAMNLPLRKGAKSIGIFEYGGELRPAFALRGQRYVLGKTPVASYPLN